MNALEAPGRPWREFLDAGIEVEVVHSVSQVFGNIQLTLHKGPIHDQLRGLVSKARLLPRLDLFPHRLKVPLHAVHADREDVHETKVLGVLGEHGCKHARDNVAKLGVSHCSAKREQK